MLIKNNNFKSKKGGNEFSIEKVIVLLLAILVLVAIVVFITKPQILEWIRNQPGYTPAADNESEMTCDQMKLLSYEKIGKLVLDKRGGDIVRHYYVTFQLEKEKTQTECPLETWRDVCFVNDCPDNNIKNSADCTLAGGNYEKHCVDLKGNIIYALDTKESTVYWDWNVGEEGEGDLMISKFGSDLKIGKVSNNFFVIDSVIWSSLEKDYSDYVSYLKKLDGAKYISGGIYKSKVKVAGAAPGPLVDNGNSVQPSLTLSGVQTDYTQSGANTIPVEVHTTP